MLDRLYQTREQWISTQLAVHFREDTKLAQQACSGCLPVPKVLGESYSQWDRRRVKQIKSQKAATQRHFEIVHPELAELRRKFDREEVEERATAEKRAKAEERERAATIPDLIEACGPETKEDVNLILGTGKQPLVWTWEKNDNDPVDVDSTHIKAMDQEIGQSEIERYQSV
jgi:tellurite resistance protein